MKRLFLLGGVLLAFSVVNTNAQSATSTTSATTSKENVETNISTTNNTSTLPGFPVYVNTGNPQQDAITYKEAKDKWIRENQDLYNAELKKLEAGHEEGTNQEGIDKMKKQPENKSTQTNSTND